jgi:hypothetical protein
LGEEREKKNVELNERLLSVVIKKIAQKGKRKEEYMRRDIARPANLSLGKKVMQLVHLHAIQWYMSCRQEGG